MVWNGNIVIIKYSQKEIKFYQMNHQIESLHHLQKITFSQQLNKMKRSKYKTRMDFLLENIWVSSLKSDKVEKTLNVSRT